MSSNRGEEKEPAEDPLLLEKHNLFVASSETWTKLASNETEYREYLGGVRAHIEGLITACRTQVLELDELAKRHDKFRKKFKRTIIWMTGVVAILNFVAASNYIDADAKSGVAFGGGLLALIITVIANFDSFLNFGDSARTASKYQARFHALLQQLYDLRDLNPLSSLACFDDLRRACQAASELSWRYAALNGDYALENINTKKK